MSERVVCPPAIDPKDAAIEAAARDESEQASVRAIFFNRLGELRDRIFENSPIVPPG